MSAEATPVIDIAAIFGLLFIRQPELTEGSPLLCNMTQMMDLLPQGMCGHTHKGNTWTNTLSFWTHTHTHTHISARLCMLLSSVVWIHISCRPKSAHILFYSTSAWQMRLRPGLQNGNLTCKSHVGLNPQGWARPFYKPASRRWHHPRTAADDLRAA